MNRLSTVLFAALFCAFACGCSAKFVRERPLRVACTVESTLDAAPAVAELAKLEGVKVQHLQGEWKGRIFEAQAVLKGDGKSFTAVMLAPQMRLLTVEVTPPYRMEWVRARQLPEVFEPEYVLLDLAYVNLPLEVLKSALAPDLNVFEEGGVRTLSTPSGEVVTIVRFESDGTCTLENPVREYRYTVTSE